MSTVKSAIVGYGLLLLFDATAADKPSPAAAPAESDMIALSKDDLQKLVDLSKGIGSLSKCQPSICAFMGVTAKLSIFSQLRCTAARGASVSFASLSEASDGYLFSLSIHNDGYFFHTDTHLRVIGVAATQDKDALNPPLEPMPDGVLTQGIDSVSYAWTRCLQQPLGIIGSD
jgi:hypothetical protein